MFSYEKHMMLMQALSLLFSSSQKRCLSMAATNGCRPLTDGNTIIVLYFFVFITGHEHTLLDEGPWKNQRFFAFGIHRRRTILFVEDGSY
jgi:hypothetical protein